MKTEAKVFEIIKIQKAKSQKINKNDFWTIEEDELLIKISNESRKSRWKKASLALLSKSSLECARRYNLLNKNIKKGRWTKDEDAKLLMLIDNFGESWKLISKILKNRTCKQIRNRFKEHLVVR